MELNAYKIHDALRSCFEFRWSCEDGRLELWWWIGSKVYTQAFPGEHVRANLDLRPLLTHSHSKIGSRSSWLRGQQYLDLPQQSLDQMLHSMTRSDLTRKLNRNQD